MVDTLLHTETAWQLYLSKLAYNGLAPVLWETVEGSCADGSQSWDVMALFAGISNEEVAATLIGIDPDSCISYWHLTGGKARFHRADMAFSCVPIWSPGAPAGFLLLPQEDASPITEFDVSVFDGGSDTSPHTGEELLPHPGYPVCAAVKVTETGWAAFAAGDAAGLSVAEAATACEVGSQNVCGSGGECDTHIEIWFS